MEERRPTRRQLLRFGGVGLAGGLAGCLGGADGQGGATDGDQLSTTAEGSSTAAPAERATGAEPATTNPASPTPAGTLGETAKLVPGDGDRDDEFGASVALADGTALVGAPGDRDTEPKGGSAYVFERADEGWTQRAKLVPDDSEDAYHFGFGDSVALAGDTALVGDWASQTAYVFERTNGQWRQSAKLVPEDVSKSDFGWAVALAGSGDTALIGARSGEDPAGDSTGSAYVFERTDGHWAPQSKLVPRDGESGDYFGFSVALSGTTALVGAKLDQGTSSIDLRDGGAGSAYVFERTDDGWAQQSKLVLDDGGPEDRLGGAVALAAGGDTGLAGAVGYDAPGPNGDDAGAGYVFQPGNRDDAGRARLVPGDGDAGDHFGKSVALAGSGTTALVGAWNDEDPNGSNEDEIFGGAGSAYVFRRTDRGWRQHSKLVPADGDSEDHFGRAVALSKRGTTALVGAPNDEDPNGSRAGSAYVFER